MKKVLVTGAALMLAGGIASTTAAAADEPGVKITGDARVRLYYMDDQFRSYGTNAAQKSQTDFDSRVRLVFTGTTAGGTYARVRLRIAESYAGDQEYGDYSNAPTWRNSNVVADMAYVGIPFGNNTTLELGRYRSTYGPLPGGFNFFYDDVNLTGARGIIKFDNVEINPFVEWMNEGQNSSDTGYNTNDANSDNDTIRFGAHAKVQINKDWLVGGMAAYQVDNRDERGAGMVNIAGVNHWDVGSEDNDGFFGSLYVNGKSGNFAIVGEVAMTSGNLNNFNSWEYDNSGKNMAAWNMASVDSIGSADTGFGGFIFPNYQIDKLNIGLNLGFTTGGFQPDGAFGDGVLLGTIDNSVISAIRIGDYGDWLWAGLVVSYQFRDDLKLTGNFFYANIDAWDTVGPDGDGPLTNYRSLNKLLVGPSANGRSYLNPAAGLNNAWSISAMLQYTVTKNTDIYFSAGYLKPSMDNPYDIAGLNDDGIFGAATRIEIKF